MSPSSTSDGLFCSIIAAYYLWNAVCAVYGLKAGRRATMVLRQRTRNVPFGACHYIKLIESI